ncbi:response regulator [Ruegeria denitrificans]|uniref:Response regulator n=1 Tax=Ruegeria denitrificans TaxID=1715692 RepID=A0A0P1IJ71_9RHOB|nr:LuxR C-terminal-related transcriptional regulator [Ruegeria denitrificans]CUJ98697.1 response regulator [Ruegeria denitrificans]
MSVSFSNGAFAQQSLNFVMEWVHALNGDNTVSNILQLLVEITNADAALITRINKPEHKVNYIARCSINEGKVWPVQPRTQIDLVLGDNISTAKAGTVWKLTEALPTDRTRAINGRDQVPTGLVEVLVIPLETKGGNVDHLELHYSHSPRRNEMGLLTALAPTLASGWSRRVPGSVTTRSEQIRGYLPKIVKDTKFVPILDPQNPTQLSRSEFRVCAMMKEGMTVKKISQILSVCPATVRSHLSSIFSKTGASNQVELLHLLNRNADTADTFMPSEIVSIS